MFLDCLQDLVRIQLQVTHDLSKHVPFNLRERKAYVFVRQQRVIAPASFVERAIDDSLG